MSTPRAGRIRVTPSGKTHLYINSKVTFCGVYIANRAFAGKAPVCKRCAAEARKRKLSW